MGSTTPVLGFPYPVGTDRVMDGDNAIQSLAQAVETNLIGASQTLTAPAFAGGTIEIWRRGRIGFIRAEGLITPGAGIAAGVTVATLPVGYRPATSWRVFLMQFSGTVTATIMFELQAAGPMVISSTIPNQQTLYGSWAYAL